MREEKPTTTEKEWVAHGLVCRVLFVRQSHRCGYVVVPKGHVCFEVSYDDIPVQVHGGLTYASMEHGYWVVGFDCSHAGDRSAEMSSSDSSDHFWTTAEVMAETEQLAEQISRVTAVSIAYRKTEWLPDHVKARFKIVEAKP